MWPYRQSHSDGSLRLRAVFFGFFDRGFIPTCQPERFAELAKEEKRMPVYRLTPEETRALLGQGLITFDQRTIQALRRQRDEERKRAEESLQDEQEEDADESDS